MLFITYIFILLIFILLSYTLYKIVKLWFNFKSKGQESEHYPITLGITLLSIPLISKAFAIPSYLIKVFNQYTSLNLPAPTDDWKSMVFYGIYVFAVIALSYIYYKLPPRKEEQFRDDRGVPKIDYPDNTQVILSPHLHERIKEIFELKFEKLTLSYDDKEKVLVGQYSDAIHSYRYFIYCDSKLQEVSKSKQEEVLTHLKKLSDEFVVNDSTYYEPKYFFFIENGTFEEQNNQHLKSYTEDGFLNVIIDFSRYLEKNIECFDTNPIDIGGVSLKESFIEPSFNKGEINLKLYFDEWLEENSLRHISLLADYGMGKTSFLKYYTKYLSQKILEGESFSRYPVFISLTNTSPMSNDGIETKIESFVAKELGVNYALFERLVHLGKVVFILDGFDEMGFIGTAKTRFDQFNSIWQLATKNNKVLISGRPSYLPTDFERKNVLNIVDSSVTDVQLTPFTEVVELDYFKLEQIEQTVNIYYQGQEVEQYMNYIQRNRSILDLCKRPSMLHMTMSILPTLYSEDTHKVITSSDIMNKYTEYWISRQESKAITGYFSKNDNRKKEFIMNFFTELSGEMFKDGTLIVSKKVLEELIVKEVQKAKLEIASNEAMFEGFKNELYAGYFIEVDIANVKENYFKFVHKSLFEFFVSKKIIKLIVKKKFDDELMEMNWNHEVMDFIDNSIDHEKYKNSKYPSLIMLRNSWMDKFIYIPLTTFSPKYFFVFYLFLIGIFQFSKSLSLSFSIYMTIMFLLTIYLYLIAERTNKINYQMSKVLFKKNLKFIQKAYFFDYIKNKNLKSNQLQFFLNMNELFSKHEDQLLINKSYKKLSLHQVQFTYSELMEVDFSEAFIDYLLFKESYLRKNYFTNTKIRYISFENSFLKSIYIDNSQFIKMKLYQKRTLKLLYPLIVLVNLFNKNDKFQIKRNIIKANYSKIVFKKMTLEHFDSQSLNSFQNFIKNNNMQRRDVICTSNELKDKLFAKSEEKE